MSNLWFNIPLFSNWLLIPKFFIFGLLKIVFLLVSIAYYTLAERKIMASVQRRQGPNVVGIYGLLQPVMDGVKLLLKNLLIPTASNPNIFVLAPLCVLVLSLVSWGVIPGGVTVPLFNITNSNFTVETINWFNSLNYYFEKFPFSYSYNLSDDNNINLFIHSLINLYTFSNISSGFTTVANLNYSVLFLLAISSFNVYGIIISGWSSYSKYAFLGSLRSAAQMISYEVSIGLVILPVIMLSGSLNLTKIILSQYFLGWYILPLFPVALIFFVSMLAETNRTPFDLAEAEAELVAGYNTEYASIIFAMFFLAEYGNMILMSTVFIMLFFGGWLPGIFAIPAFWFISPAIMFSAKVMVICYLFVIVRATLPRYRYDQLMSLGWKVFLPFTFAYLILLAGLLFTTNSCIFNSEII